MKIDHRDVNVVESKIDDGTVAVINYLHHVINALSTGNLDTAAAATGRIFSDIAGLQADNAWLDAVEEAIEEAGEDATSDLATIILQDSITERIARLTDTSLNGLPMPMLYQVFNQLVLAEVGTRLKTIGLLEAEAEDDIQHVRALCLRNDLDFTQVLAEDPDAIRDYKIAMAAEVGIECDALGRYKVDPLKAAAVGLPPEDVAPVDASLDGERSEIPDAALTRDPEALHNPEAERSMGFAERTGPVVFTIVGNNGRDAMGEALAAMLSQTAGARYPRFGAGAPEEPSGIRIRG